MTDEWITAQEALAILSSGRAAFDAELEICQRAGAGQIKARAGLFIRTEGDRKSKEPDFEICEEFWGGIGTPTPEQNWESGLFSNWFDGKIYCEAFDVTFERVSIEAISIKNVGEAGQPSPENGKHRASGGSPGKYDWARAVGTVIFKWADAGNWQPGSQGAVRQELAAWFAANDQSPDDKQLKHYARWLFSEFSSRKGEG